MRYQCRDCSYAYPSNRKDPEVPQNSGPQTESCHRPIIASVLIQLPKKHRIKEPRKSLQLIQGLALRSLTDIFAY